MRPALILILMVFTGAAHAQWGIGLVPSAQCPYGYGPGAGAVSGRDEIANLTGKYNAARNELDAIQEELDAYDEKLSQARSDMGRVLPGSAIRGIEEHNQFKRGYYDYYNCPANPTTASASGTGVAVTLPRRGAGANPGGSDGSSSAVYPPEDFCYRGDGGKPYNAWADFVQDGGGFSEDVCNYNIPSFRGVPDSERARDCKQGLRDYYRYISRKRKLETRRAQLDAQCRALERRLNRIDEEIAEGTYCPYCAAQRRGYSTGSLTESIIPMVGMLAMAAFGGNQNRGPRPMMVPRPAPPFMPFPGPGAYPGNPYPAVTPGYMGVNNGVYGALPGGIGPGGFGCGGTSPMFGNPYSPGPQPFLNSTNNPFGNPYSSPLMNPAMQNPLFMPGFGPGFGPVLGNGVNGYNPYDPFGNPYGNAFGNPYMAGNNPYAPSVLPYLNQNPFFSNPYQLGNANLYGNPYMGQNPYGNPFGNPFGNPQLFGNNPYAPGVLPYMGGPGYGMPGYGTPGYGYPGYGMPGYGGGNPYGNPYMYGNPALANYGGMNNSLSSFYWQMEQMKRTISTIQNSPIFGGSAPAVLPYPGPGYGLGYGGYNPGYRYGFGYGGGSPIYNTPGGVFNPLPQPLPMPPPSPPQPQPPMNPPPTNPGGIIRSR